MLGGGEESADAEEGFAAGGGLVRGQAVALLEGAGQGNLRGDEEEDLQEVEDGRGFLGREGVAVERDPGDEAAGGRGERRGALLESARGSWWP